MVKTPTLPRLSNSTCGAYSKLEHFCQRWLLLYWVKFYLRFGLRWPRSRQTQIACRKPSL